MFTPALKHSPSDAGVGGGEGSTHRDQRRAGCTCSSLLPRLRPGNGPLRWATSVNRTKPGVR